ncbi:DUF2508 family protein [Halalkalibacterium halodurans]|uniref:YaaL family protein n=1 Tax=Halalkalibacterium halodurans TaxID=86665 RepID=UPI001067511D|nr:YaaL family protein [Halalkalibacterium halodurans]TES47367.1 DUF2508 family protein [Halalkalibacterium halodurans]
MFFRKKGKIRKIEDERLLAFIEKQKKQLEMQQQMVENSVDPSEEVLYRLKLTKVKYLFLLKEARVRNTSKR